eukprot:206358-Amphidinium_carterae.1
MILLNIGPCLKPVHYCIILLLPPLHWGCDGKLLESPYQLFELQDCDVEKIGPNLGPVAIETFATFGPTRSAC